MSGPSKASIRRIILTGSVAAITATGTWYGAGLKTQQERNQDKKTTLEATAADQLEQMETLRAQLVYRRDELQAKIDQLTNKTSPTPGGASLPPRGR